MNESHALRRLLRFLWQFRLWLLISLLCAFISVLFRPDGYTEARTLKAAVSLPDS